jgi:hypothetical protein
MTLKELRRRRQRLIFHWKMDPQGVADQVAQEVSQVVQQASQAYEAVLKPDPKSLIDLGKELTDLGKKLTDLGLALAWLGPDGKGRPENLQFHEQVESVLVKLLTKHGTGPNGVRPQMIYDAVNPIISRQQYSQAFRRIGVKFDKKTGIGWWRARRDRESRSAEIVK